MTNMKERFIELLKEDVQNLRQQIEAWKAIEDDGGWLETDTGKITPGEMMHRCQSKIDELQSIIAKIK